MSTATEDFTPPPAKKSKWVRPSPEKPLNVFENSNSKLNPLEMLEIVEIICLHLPKKELKVCQNINVVWKDACLRELDKRKLECSSLR